MHRYNCKFETTGEKKGKLNCNGIETLIVSTPPEFDGPGEGTSPEHLFCASVLTCTMSTLWTMLDKLRVDATNVKGEGVTHLDKAKDKKGFVFTKIEIEITASVPDSSNANKFKDAVELAERYCFVNRAIKGNIEIEINAKPVIAS